jgi:phytoene desaturase
MAKSAIVIGAGQGGLSAAIHARLKGYDVLVVEQGSGPGGKAASIEINGYRLDPGPSIIILTDIYKRVFRDAGRNPDDYLRFQRLDPFTRVFFEGTNPMDLPADADECIRVLADQSPQDKAHLVKLMAKLDKVRDDIDRTIFARPFTKPWQLAHPSLIKVGLQFDVRKSYRELVDGWFTSPLLRAFFYGFPSYGGQTYDSKAAGALMIPYLMLRDGVWYPEGGVAAIPHAFFLLAVELGVEFRFDAKVTGLEREGSRITGVKTETGTHRADQIISNVDPATFGALLGREETRSASLSYFTVHLGIRRELPQLKHHTLVVPKDFEPGFEELYRKRTFPNAPIVYLNATRTVDPTTAPAGHENLFAVVTVPSMEPGLDWESRREEFKLKTLETVRLAGIEITPDHVDFERIQDPLYFRRQHGNYLGSLYGLDESHREMGGIFPHFNFDREFSNLFYVGGAVQPGAGLPMVTLSGRFAAAQLP